MPDDRILIGDELLRRIAEEIDIPPSKYKEAVERYSAVGDWLVSGQYDKVIGKPYIYPQGSFKLGTVVRPVRNGAERDYDIDLVCQMTPAPGLSARDLKAIVGDRLKENKMYKEMLDAEGRRCWTLNYTEKDSIGFHLDVLPCIPRVPVAHPAVRSDLALKAISITDRSEDKSRYTFSPSNPAGFADWFWIRQQSEFLRVAAIRKAEIQRKYSSLFAKVDDVPDLLVRTPLQQAIQILKRHRDTRFAGREDECDKPISMIITTLAASAYQQEISVYSTLANFLDRIQDFDSNGIIKCIDNKWVIANPVDPNENFADRWNDEGSLRPDAFFRWIDWLRADLDDILNSASKAELQSNLRKAFGDIPGGRVAAAYDGLIPGAQGNPSSMFRRTISRLFRFDVGHRQLPRWHITPTRYKAWITACHEKRGFRSVAFDSNSTPLPKYSTLHFEANTDVPKPYGVFWQVVNTGREASQAGSLRGGFYDSSSAGRRRTESTLYSGTHWIECFIVKNGACVSRSGEFIVNIK